MKRQIISKEFLHSDEDSRALLYGSKLHVSSSDEDQQITKARSVETSIQCTYKQFKKQPTFLSPPSHSTTVETADMTARSLTS